MFLLSTENNVALSSRVRSVTHWNAVWKKTDSGLRNDPHADDEQQPEVDYQLKLFMVELHVSGHGHETTDLPRIVRGNWRKWNKCWCETFSLYIFLLLFHPV